MSDSDDWEKNVDEVVESTGKEESKTKKFNDEDAVDSDEERLKAEEQKKKQAALTADAPRQKAQSKDYDKLFEERNKKKSGASTQPVQLDNKKSAGAKAEEASRAAEQDITEQLFATEVNVEAAALKTEKDYVNFAQQVSKVLYEGKAGYNIPAFFNELTRGIGKSQFTTAEEIKKIVDTVTVIYNNKVAEEKKKEGAGKKSKAKAKPTISQGKAVSYDRNNNPGMVSDLVGDDEVDDYGEDYDDETEYKGKVPENAYDFM